MGFKDFLFEHPVATVFLGWSGVDVVRLIVNAINNEQHRRHIERVDKIRVDAVNSGKVTEEEVVTKITYFGQETEEKKKDSEEPEDNKEGEEDS